MATVDREPAPISCPINDLAILNGFPGCHEECAYIVFFDEGSCPPLINDQVFREADLKRPRQTGTSIPVDNSGVESLKRLLNIT